MAHLLASWTMLATLALAQYPGARLTSISSNRQPDEAAAPVQDAAAQNPQSPPLPPAEIPTELLTVAERSGFKATARHEDVVALLDRLAAQAPDVARRIDMGTTTEGRAIPMLILANPPVATAAEAQAQVESGGKLVVLMLGNIHAGEVDGKEGLPMLARDLILADERPLLDRLILCFAPIYNADGNERVAPGNRPGQVGPEEGMGTRENAQGFDLNRDFVKAEAPETRALLKFLRGWDPAVLIDTHTTNGSLHRYLVTYAGPKAPAGDAALTAFVRDELLPAVTARVKERHGFDTFFYGNFNADHTRWETFPAEARYGTTYTGLRNRIGILSEGYSYAPYQDRVLGTRDFVRECLEYVAAHGDRVRQALDAADEAARRGPEGEPIALRSAAKPRAEKATVLGFVEEERDGHVVATDEHMEYEVELVDDFIATHSVDVPAGYLYPASYEAVTDNLLRHGIAVEELREDITLHVEAYTVDALDRATSAFQEHHLVKLEATPRAETRHIPAGTRLVRTTQDLGRLAAYLLEPECEDGLTTWNFFDVGLAADADFPVLRLVEGEGQPLLTTAVRPLDEDRTFGKRITYDAVTKSEIPTFSGWHVGNLQWLDGEAYLESKQGRLHRVNAVTGRSEPFEIDSEAMAAALMAIPAISERTARNWAESAWFRMDPQRSGAIFDHENDLYYATFDGSHAIRLTSTPQREELATFSPDGRFVAFVLDNDLHVVDVATGSDRALTTGGGETLRNGKADWVYFEELFGRSWRAYWWSPDSTRLAFLQTDSSDVPQFTLVHDGEYEQEVERAAYPKPGQPNPRVRLGFVTIAGGSPAFADFSSMYDANSVLVSGVGWYPDGRNAYCFVQDRAQTWLDVCKIGSRGGTPTRLLRDRTQAWIESPGELRFLADGSFIMTSPRTGWTHLYRYDEDGNETGAITSGEWDVRGLTHLDESGGRLYFTATKDNPLATNLYRCRLDDGSELQRLTHAPGSHGVEISPDGRHFIDTWSSREATPRVALFSTADGSLVRTLDSNPVHAIEEYQFGREEFVQIPARDGHLLEATILHPPDFDPTRKYPVWYETYGGPGGATIHDVWQGGRTHDQMLANEGIVLFQCDPRSASGRGAQSAWAAYRQLGVAELRDIEDAIHWLSQRPYIDAARIGMAGHSYGGYITAYAMTHSPLFCAGIAGAPPTDWRDYDSIYTERYMDTPQNNPEGYDASSVLNAAANLHGRLLLIHGTMDDNVHAQNSIRFVRALQEADKDFELMLYPGYRHGVWGRHYQRTTFEFIKDSLCVTAAATPTMSPEPPPVETLDPNVISSSDDASGGEGN